MYDGDVASFKYFSLCTLHFTAIISVSDKVCRRYKPTSGIVQEVCRHLHTSAVSMRSLLKFNGELATTTAESCRRRPQSDTNN